MTTQDATRSSESAGAKVLCEMLETGKSAPRDLELERLREEIATLKATRSWKITAPLRSVYTKLFRPPTHASVRQIASEQHATARDEARQQLPPATAASHSATEPADPTMRTDEPCLTTDPLETCSSAQASLPEATADNRASSTPQEATSYLLNDASYWDTYVREWEGSSENAKLQRLGNEWKGEEIFLDLLSSCAKSDQIALEIGCGGGRITAEAVPLVRHLHAADISDEMLRKCKAGMTASNLSFHKLDAFTLDEFTDESLDLIFSHDVFVHFSSLQVYSYLKEIHRVLRPGGIGLISFYNFFRHFELFKEMSLGLQEQHQFPPHMRVHFISLPVLRRMLDDLGFDEIIVDRRNFLILGFVRPSRTQASP